MQATDIPRYPNAFTLECLSLCRIYAVKIFDSGALLRLCWHRLLSPLAANNNNAWIPRFDIQFLFVVVIEPRFLLLCVLVIVWCRPPRITFRSNIFTDCFVCNASSGSLWNAWLHYIYSYMMAFSRLSVWWVLLHTHEVGDWTPSCHTQRASDERGN